MPRCLQDTPRVDEDYHLAARSPPVLSAVMERGRERKERSMVVSRSHASWALALWLVLYGVFHFVAVPSESLILAVLAIIAGIILFLGR
jgi:hypothetical protein